MTPAALPTATLGGAALVAVCTVVGVVLAGRTARWPAATSTAVAVLLVAVVLGDLLPDVRADLAEAGVAWWVAGLAGAAGFTATGQLVRRGCGCPATADDADRGPAGAAAEVAGGTAAAAAVAAHRGLEGAALALAGSPAVLATLALHAAGEGYALGTLLARASRARTVGLLLVACVSPLVGAVVADELPEPAAPVVTAAVGGALLRGGWLAARVAVRRPRRRGALPGAQPA